MDFRQIETQLRALFADTHGDEFKKIGVLFAMLNGCQPAKLQRATGYEMPLIQAVLEDVGTHAPFAIYSGAMAPRHLWIEYPQTRELIEAITGQKLIQEPIRSAPLAISVAQRTASKAKPAPSAPQPKPAMKNTDTCGYDGCTRQAGHAGRHYRKSETARKPRQLPYQPEDARSPARQRDSFRPSGGFTRFYYSAALSSFEGWVKG